MEFLWKHPKLVTAIVIVSFLISVICTIIWYSKLRCTLIYIWGMSMVLFGTYALDPGNGDPDQCS